MNTSANKPIVFYGICGEGLGHYSRAAVLIPLLLNNGYNVEIFTSGRVADLCKEQFPTCCVHPIPGLRMTYRANAIFPVQEYFNALQLMFKGLLTSPYVARQAMRNRPIAAISDYEPIVAWTARRLQIPIITLDHQQIATEFKINYNGGRWINGKLLRLSNQFTYPKPELRIISSFFKAPFRKADQKSSRRLIGPVLRPKVLRRKPVIKNHVVVYQTSRTFRGLDRILNRLPGEKRVYGVGSKYSGYPEQAFSEKAFLDDLSSCRFALVNGGHTTISEALYYGKPLLCYPVKGHAEQEINAYYVSRSGFGMSYLPDCGEEPDFSEFIAKEEDIRQRIAGTAIPNGNSELETIVLHHLTNW